MKVIKRNGSLVEFDSTKIDKAIRMANNETNELKSLDILLVMGDVVEVLKGEEVEVEQIQDEVEKALIARNFYKTAKAYILYRAKRSEERKLDVFKFRKNLKPYEYPDLHEYANAIRHSYWVHTEFNYTSDIQDFHVNTTEAERNAIKNSMLAIAQVEVAVKTFWGDLYHRMPKPELGAVGAVFAESETRHSDAYSHLLEILGLNEEFEKIEEIPALIERVDYLTRSTHFARTGNDRDYVVALILFSLFIEHVSLFSQFLVIMSFNKHKNLFKGMSNAIEATSKEEELHGQFGIDLVNTIRNERPEWFDEKMKETIIDTCIDSYAAEKKVIDWIYEQGDLEFMPKHDTLEFVKNRLNNSLESIGYDRIFDIDDEAVGRTDWFDDELISTKMTDFFVKRSVNYTKRSRSITGDDLF